MPRGVPREKNTAATNPVIVGKALESADQQVGQDAPRTLKSTGDAKDALEAAGFEVVDRPLDPEKMAMMAFMDELMTIRIATSTDKNAEQVFELNINGKLEFFRRGESKTVKRYFVDRLARLKETGYAQREVVNSEGIKDIVHDSRTGLKYDFAVIRDDHPRGADWLKHVLAEGG